MPTLNEQLLALACEMLGVRRIPGKRHDSRIVSFLRAVGLANRGDETPWCSAFAKWVAERSGADCSLATAAARSWQRVGQPVPPDSVAPGDVVILWRGSRRGWRGHVGFFLRDEENHIWILGGNQGGRICAKRYPKSRVLTVRRLAE
jgi:uncharacterized protein (TIGR02594 family)